MVTNPNRLVVVAGLIYVKDTETDAYRILMRRRPLGVEFADCWEFPGGKQEGNETVDETLRREMFEETGVLAERLEEVGRHDLDPPQVRKPCTIIHMVSHRSFGDARPLERGSEVRWVLDAFLLGQKVTPGVAALAKSGFLEKRFGWRVSFG